MTESTKRRGFMFVLSSPSGAGKTTISRLLLANDDNLEMSVSVTTRPKREGEIDNIDYNFISKEQFDEMNKRNELLENAEVFGNYYGTPDAFIEQKITSGIDILFDIDWQGVEQLAAKRKSDLVSIFILPPSMQELERRLRNRGQDSDDVIQNRMNKASAEIANWKSYDYVIVNHDVNESLQQVTCILKAERLKQSRQNNLSQFIDDL